MASEVHGLLDVEVEVENGRSDTCHAAGDGSLRSRPMS